MSKPIWKVIRETYERVNQLPLEPCEKQELTTLGYYWGYKDAVISISLDIEKFPGYVYLGHYCADINLENYFITNREIMLSKINNGYYRVTYNIEEIEVV